MRVGVNARTFGVDEPGGAVQAAKRFAAGLIDDGDLDVVLFGSASVREEFPTAEVDGSLYVDSQAAGVVWERTVLPALARKHDVDVLYCPNGNGPLTEQPFPVAMCVHDVNALKGWSSGVHQLYRRATVPRAAAAADRIVTVSSFSGSEISRHAGVDPEKITVVPNGIDERYFAGDPGTPLELPDRYVLYVGSMNPRKNVAGAVEAHRRLRATVGDGWNLVLIGPGNKAIFKETDVRPGDGVVLPGFVSPGELKYAYENASAFVYPSFYEGFGLPPLEAMACGTPVVASDIGSLSEVLGGAARFVDPHDPDDIARGLRDVLTSERLRERLVRDGLANARAYRWEEAVARLQDALAATADGRAPPVLERGGEP